MVGGWQGGNQAVDVVDDDDDDDDGDGDGHFISISSISRILSVSLSVFIKSRHPAMIHPSSPDEMQRHLLLYPEKWKRLWLFWLIYNKSWVDFARQEINPSFLIAIKQTGRAWHIVPFCLHESFSQLVSTMSHLSRAWFSKFGIWIWKRTSPLSVCILQILYMFYTCFTSDLQDHTKHRKCKKKRQEIFNHPFTSTKQISTSFSSY